jgi:hypothetical protein
MGQLSRGGTLLDVQTRAMLVACAAAVSLSLASPTQALTVKPIVDTVLSVAKLHEPTGTAPVDNKRETSKANTSTATRPSATKAPDAMLLPPATIDAPSVTPIVTAPLEPLPSIEMTEMRSLSASAHRPAASLAVSPAVLGATNDTAAALQSSNHGWKVFGVAWYWWALIIALGYYLGRLLQRLQNRRTAETD